MHAHGPSQRRYNASIFYPVVEHNVLELVHDGRAKPNSEARHDRYPVPSTRPNHVCTAFTFSMSSLYHFTRTLQRVRGGVSRTGVECAHSIDTPRCLLFVAEAQTDLSTTPTTS